MLAEHGTLPQRAGLSDARRALLERRLRGGAKDMAKAQRIPRCVRNGSAPLSFAQQRLWFLNQLEPDSPLYNMPMCVRLSGPLDPGALEAALTAILARHEALRTRFVSQDGNPAQVAGEPAPVQLPVVDLSRRSEAEVQQLLSAEARRPFDLTRDVLLRATLLRLAETEHLLLLSMHHIASDGWSCGVLFRELAALYEDLRAGRPASLPELPIQYADFAVWQRERMHGEAMEKQLAYWKQQLAGAPDFLEVPADHPRPVVQTFSGGCESLTLPASLGGRLKDLSRREGATLFMLLLAAFQTLLHRHTRQTDILVGTPFAGRNQVEVEHLIGFFINTLVLRGDLSGNPTVRELLGRVRSMTLEAYAHPDLPFEKLVEELRPGRSAHHQPLIQVMFALQNAPPPPRQSDGLTLKLTELETGTAKLDLTFSVQEDADGLTTTVEYNRDLFVPATITRLLGHWRVLLEGVATSLDQRISELPLLTDRERRQLLVEWNATATDYPREETIHGLFEQQVRQSPDRVALVFGTRQLTYRELDERAGRLAETLQALGVGPNQLVGVCMMRSVEMLVALLGILKAGCAYVSLDPTYPKERLAVMLEDAQPAVILTQAKLQPDQLLPKTGSRLISLDTEGEADLQASGGNAPAAARSSSAADLAYVSFTSGSTGRPKGVCVPHRGVVRLVRGTDYAQFSPDDVFLQFSPVAFDASTFEIWGALLNGARLVVFPPETPSLAELGEFIQAHRITTLWLTAGLFHQMVEEQLDRLQGVRQLLSGGDVLSVPHVQKALAGLPDCRLINGYGPTENTTFTCCHHITAPLAAGRSIPLGRPIANTQVHVLDEQLQPVPIGVPGELYTGGDGLAQGYLRQPQLTAEKFVASPFSPEPGARLYQTGDLARWLPDGTIEFLGRADSQVKLRGFRIELGEIETVLARHPAVRECAVILREDTPGDKRLAAYLVVRPGQNPSIHELREFLGQRLPDYMVPAAFIFCAALPLSSNGKVDRRALPAPGHARADQEVKYCAPRDATEQALAKIWEDALGIQPVGVTDKFFDLGGHSLLAVRMVAQIEKVFGRRLPVAAVFQKPTIEQLARVIQGEGQALSGSSLVEIQSRGSRPPLFLVHGVGGGMFWGYTNLSRHLGVEQPVHAFKSRGMDGLEEFGTIEEMAAHYLSDLRAFQPQGPYFLGGYCFGGNVAYEMARRLEQQGERVALLALMNCAPSNSSYDQVRWTPAQCVKFLKNLGYWASYLWQMEPAQRRDLMLWKSRTLKRRLLRWCHRPASATTGVEADDLVDLTAQPAERRKLWEAHVLALFKHQTGTYAGPVTLFRTGGHQFFCSYDARYGWGDYVSGSITVIIVPGAHESILDEPHVQAVAKELAGELAQLQANQTRTENP